MDGFEFNKLFAAVLIALLLAMLAGIFGEAIVSPVRKLPKNVLHVEIKESVAGAAGPVEKVFTPIKDKLATADIAKGEKIFKKCMQCHGLEAGQHHIGPSLWGVVGRAVAHFADYAYSSAMKEKSNETWDVESLNHFLYKPKDYVKGTKMTFLGIEDDQDRIDLIAFLQKKDHN